MSVSPYPYRFTVKPTRSGRYYFDVFVDETREEMWARVRDTYADCPWFAAPPDDRASLAAVVRATDSADPWYLGSIFFSDQHIGGGIVAHEMTHAGLRYIEKKGIKLHHWEHATSEPDEEALCDAVGHLCLQFWLRFNDRYFGEGALV